MFVHKLFRIHQRGNFSLILILILACISACSSVNQVIQPTPTPAPLTVQFTTLDLGLPPAALNAPITGTVPDTTVLHVGITFKISQDQFNQLGNNNQPANATPSSNDIAAKLGIDDATYQKMKAFFGIVGASLKLGKTRTNLTVDAKASSFATLFQTRFVVHTLNGRSFYTPDPAKPPRIPTLLANVILAVTGLDNYSRPPEHRFVPTKQRAIQKPKSSMQADCSVDSTTVLPQNIANAYGFTKFWNAKWHGENMTVNLVEIDGFDKNDVSNYFSCVGFKGQLATVTIDGSAPAPGGEATLDLDMLAGMAPALHIVDYQTDASQGQNYSDVWVRVNDALQQIINDNATRPDSASVVSISLGLAEAYMTRNDMQAIDQSFQLLTKALHMTVFVASGDCAAFTDHTFNSLSVSFPASDPYAVAVGGTVMHLNNQGRSNEVAWSDGTDIQKCQNQWGTGGGVSTTFTRPVWQTGSGVSNRYSDGKRQLPDISAIADNLPVYFQGQWIVVGGTSAATPIWAAGMALVNQGLLSKQGAYFYGPDVFYNAASSAGRLHPFYDVTRGNNLFYPATAGWDYTTGLGTPNLADFFSVLYQSLH